MYAVGCKCGLQIPPPSLKQYPLKLSEFYTGLELIYVDLSCSWLET